jgi:hypothetical protein
MSPELEERVCFTACQAGSFEGAAAVAAKWGSAVDDSTIQRHAQKAGRRVEAAAQARVERALDTRTRGEVVAEAAQRVPNGRFALVIMMDGWLSRERGEQWGWKPAEAQAKRVEWREMKAAVVFRLDQRTQNQSGRGMILEKFYEAWRGDPFEFGRRVYALALRKGLNQADKVYVISDGAAWIWNIAEDRFSEATGILDFYHASQHLWAVARELRGEDEAAARRWVEPLLHELRHGGQAKVLAKLEATLGRLRRQGSPSAEAVGREAAYFRTHQDRLDYEGAAQEGAPIGSGAMESGCRQMQVRLKGPGMFWSAEGKNNLIALDLAYRNGDWDTDFFYAAA